MKPTLRAVASAAAILAALSAVAALYARGWIGFPDGHLTEYDRAYERLLTVWMWVGSAVAIGLCGLALLDRRRLLLPAFAVVVLLAAGLVVYSAIVLPGLEHGQGG